jgi:uncharacterized caspase-like protein
MARRKQQTDVISRLAHTGEEALQRLAELPGGTRFLQAANALRDQVDELTKRMRSLDPLERRVSELERRLDELSKPAAKARKPARRAPARGATGTRSASTRSRKPSGSS